MNLCYNQDTERRDANVKGKITLRERVKVIWKSHFILNQVFYLHSLLTSEAIFYKIFTSLSISSLVSSKFQASLCVMEQLTQCIHLIVWRSCGFSWRVVRVFQIKGCLITKRFFGATTFDNLILRIFNSFRVNTKSAPALQFFFQVT